MLDHEGFAIDLKEGTRRTVKFRHDDDIVIVTHEDKGWFDARSDAKGDVLALATYLLGLCFSEALAAVGDLVAFQPTAPAWDNPARRHRRAAPPRSPVAFDRMADSWTTLRMMLIFVPWRNWHECLSERVHNPGL